MYNKLQPLSAPRPKRPFAYVVYVYSDMSLSKGHLGSGGGGGEASKNTLKYTFHLSSDKLHNFKYNRTHGQEGYCKVLEMNSSSILFSLALLLFEN